MRVLYIDIDSLRPDHMGCYGYARPTTPRLDAVAAEGVRFTRYFCADSPCVPSRAALFTARPGIRSGIVAHENTASGCDFRFAGDARGGGDAPSLAARLAAGGYHTASISTFPDRHRAGWFTLGFREIQIPSLKGGNEDAPEVNTTAVPWLKDNAAKDNWFLHLNYWDPHTLYTEPPQYADDMAKYPAPVWPDAATIARQQGDVGTRCATMMWGDNAHDGFGKSRTPHTMPDNINSRADFEKLINGYDGAIRYLDDQLAQIFDELKGQGLWEETAIIISADHGEAFGEMGQYIEHGSVSTSVHNVPLIVRWPGLTDAVAGTVRDDHLLNIDFAPTIVEALALTPGPGWPGQSFLSAIKNKTPEHQEPLVWSHGLHTRQRAVYDGDWLFVRTYEPGCNTYAPRMLFDLKNDPHEQFDVASRHPDRVAAMQKILQQWIDGHLKATGKPDPMQLAQSDPPKPPAIVNNVLSRLAKTNRPADADRLRDVRARVVTEYAAPEAP